MDIKLIPVEKGSKFTFPALPEKVQGKYAAKYQSFDIISLGTVKAVSYTHLDVYKRQLPDRLTFRMSLSAMLSRETGTSLSTDRLSYSRYSA